MSECVCVYDGCMGGYEGNWGKNTWKISLFIDGNTINMNINDEDEGQILIRITCFRAVVIVDET